MNKSTTRPGWYNFVIVLGLSVMAGTLSFPNNVMNQLIEAFPDTATSSVRAISTIASLVGAISSLLITAVLGKRIKYKMIAIIGAILATIGGVMPFFFHSSIGVILVWRFVFGLGFGCGTIRNATISRMFKDRNESAKWLGISLTCVNVVAIIGGILAGIVSTNGWEYVFLLYLVGIVPITINIFLIKEPEVEDKEGHISSAKNVKAEETEGNFDPRVILYVVLVLCTILWSYPILSGTASLVADRNLAPAALIATIVSMYNLGAAVSGTIFGIGYKILGKRGLGTFAIGISLGLGILLLAQNAVVAGIGAFVGGVCVGNCPLYLIQWAGEVTSGSLKGFITTLLTATVSLASFASSYWITVSDMLASRITIFPTEVERTFLLSLILFVIVGVIVLIKPPFPKDRKEV